MSDSNTNNPPQRRGLNFEAFKQHAMANKIDMGLWAIRLLTVTFTLGYFLPIFG